MTQPAPFGQQHRSSSAGHAIAALAAVALGLSAVTGVPSATANTNKASAAAAEDAPFTFVVIPDTQKYVDYQQKYASTATAQTRWIRDSRATLNTKFVSGLGDMVESHPSDPQWRPINSAMKVLDDAKVPYSVVPGNHDMNVATGETPKFDQYFGPHRFLNTDWGASTRYGGYMGQNQFGTIDPVKRGNKNSYSLFTVGKQNYLVLSLEHEAPDSSLAWAQKILNRYRDRRVIVATHAFLDQNGQRNSWTSRTDQETNGGPAIWDKLIVKNCNIFMVVSGHWASATKGEARRVDNNRCGKPVQQILTDYQRRPNGGDGWLRYYTFDPAKNTVTAKTYSPTLKKYEIDADSQFTFSHNMASVSQSATVDLFQRGAPWRYRFRNSAPPSNWAARGFNGASWPKGRAPMGFGDTWRPETDIDVPDGSARAITAQFRKYADVDSLSDVTDPKLTVYADDGFIAYVNGREVGRYNIPGGATSSSTYASSVRDSPSAQRSGITFSVPQQYLVQGPNVVAIQVSANYRGTRDISLDAALRATKVP